LVALASKAVVLRSDVRRHEQILAQIEEKLTEAFDELNALIH
jgi:hypothetical protein